MNKQIKKWLQYIQFKYIVSPTDYFEFPRSRFDHINIDLVGLLLLTFNGYIRCLTCSGKYSRQVEPSSISDIRAETVAKLFYNG